MRALLEARGKAVVQFLMAEVQPAKLALIPGIDVRADSHPLSCALCCCG